MNQQRHTNEDTLTDIFGSEEMRNPAPTEFIPKGKTSPEIAYQLVKDETYPQTQPRLNLATFVTTYMDDYATRLMNEAINVNYIDETEYPRVAVMCGRCLNIVANLWNTPEKAEWKTGALGIGSSEACMLGGVAAWLRWRNPPQTRRKPLRQAEPGDELGVPGRLGEVLPALADRTAHRAPDAGSHHARSQAGAGDVR